MFLEYVACTNVKILPVWGFEKYLYINITSIINN